MKTLILIALLLVAPGAFAQSADANAGSNSQSSAGSASVNAGNAQNLTIQNPGTIEYSGRYTLRNVPGVVLGGYAGSFSSDYCGGTAQAGFGIAGFGLSGGKPVMDAVCQNLRAVDRTMGVQRSITQDAAVLYQQAVALGPNRQGTAAELERRAASKAALADALACAAVEILRNTTPAIKDAYARAGVVCDLR